MSEQPTLYRIVRADIHNHEHMAAEWLRGQRAVVRVKRCEHGNIDPHDSCVHLSNACASCMWDGETDWCPGSPTLAAES